MTRTKLFIKSSTPKESPSLVDAKLAHLRSIHPNATVKYAPKKNKIFIINDPCCICLTNQPTHYFNCRCVRKYPIVCIDCLNNKQFVQSSKCPNCRSWFSESATTPFSTDQMYTGNTRPKKKLSPAEQTRLNKSLVRVLKKERSGAKMKELIERGADIYYENGDAILYAARNGHYDIFYYLIFHLDYKTIFSIEFHIKILKAAYDNLGSNQAPLIDILHSVDDPW